jgi:hypothetical protein
MEPFLDPEVGRVCLRGRYMTAAARIEHAGVPIDVQMLTALRENWEQIELRLIERVDQNYGVYQGTAFKFDRFANWLAKRGISWPRTGKGRLATDDNTFRLQAQIFPEIAELHRLRTTMGQMRSNNLAVGSDGRNRTLLGAFGARSGRNTPSSVKFVFGPSAWLRGLIKPPPGFALAYLDWSSEEFGIGAALSGDEAMLAAYNSGDPYLAFAKRVAAIPPDGTRVSHGAIRDRFKTVCLGINYGMGSDSLAVRIKRPVVEARQLLHLHRETYRDFWRWNDGAVDHAMMRGSIETVFGWRLRIGQNSNPRSLRNFPMQANGAELLRLACCLATERGVSVCAPVHDALLIEAPINDIERQADLTEHAMREASRAVLKGFELRVDRKLIVYPDRFMDQRGEHTWRMVCHILNELPRIAPAGEAHSK